jgi:monooxygenase
LSVVREAPGSLCTMDISITGPVVFVNRFTLSGPAEEFEQAFAQTAEFLEQQPGLIEFTLLKSAERPDSYVNVARWTDLKSLMKAVRHPYFGSHAAALRKLSTSEPHIYSPAHAYQAVPEAA